MLIVAHCYELVMVELIWRHLRCSMCCGKKQNAVGVSP